MVYVCDHPLLRLLVVQAPSTFLTLRPQSYVLPARAASGIGDYALPLHSAGLELSPISTVLGGGSPRQPQVNALRASDDSLPVQGARSPVDQLKDRLDPSSTFSRGSASSGLDTLPARVRQSIFTTLESFATRSEEVSPSAATARGPGPMGMESLGAAAADAWGPYTSPRSVPGSPRLNFLPMPPLRVSSINHSSQVGFAPQSHSPTSVHASTVYGSQPAESPFSSTAVPGWSAARDVPAASPSQGRMYEGVSLHRSFTSPPAVAPSSWTSLNPPSSPGLDVPTPFQRPTHQQQRVNGNTQHVRERDGTPNADSGREQLDQQGTVADGSGDNVHFGSTISTSSTVFGQTGTTRESFERHVARNSLVATLDTNVGAISPRLTSAAIMTLASDQFQQRSVNPAAATHNLAAVALSRSVSTETLDRLARGRADPRGAGNAPVIPIILPPQPQPGSFLTGAGRVFSNAVASRFRRASTTSPSLYPPREPEVSGASFDGHVVKETRPRAPRVAPRSAWEDEPVTADPGVGQPLGEGLEVPWDRRAAAPLQRVVAPASLGQGAFRSLRGAGVSENVAGTSGIRAQAATPIAELSRTSSTTAGRSLANPDMGAGDWMVSGGGNERQRRRSDAPALPTRMLDARKQQQSADSAKRLTGPRRWRRVVTEKHRLLSHVLPSAEVQARFEFMFEDMLGVSGSTGVAFRF